MNSKHKKTLKLIFKKPMQRNLKWSDVESLFKSVDAQISEGSGSRVRIRLNGNWLVFHKPHPQKELCKERLSKIRKFLKSSGVYDDNIL